MRRRGFTLTELMIVIGIIAVLIALLLPAVQSAREAARRASCDNNLLQLGFALANYASTHTVFPPGVVSEKGPIGNLPQGYDHGWIVQILPYIGQNNLYHHVELAKSVYAAENSTLHVVHIATLLCPSSSQPAGSHYVGCHHDVEAAIASDNHGVLYLNSRVRFDDITDGLATTILLGETVQTAPTLGWPSGTRATLRNTGQPLNEPDTLYPAVRARRPSPQNGMGDMSEVIALVQDGSLPLDYVGGFSSRHTAGANFLFCNGSVRFVRNSVDTRIYRLLGHRADDELISDDSF
jgi:prepilin-type N-terminal cleavage/methylation domain-containing protein